MALSMVLKQGFNSGMCEKHWPFVSLCVITSAAASWSFFCFWFWFIFCFLFCFFTYFSLILVLTGLTDLLCSVCFDWVLRSSKSSAC